MTIVAYLPFDQDGNIPANTYSVNESGALYTIQPGSTYENFWGGLEYEGSYFGIYPEGSYYPETYYVLNGGSMTVSGSSSNYSVEFNFTAEDGSTVTGSYTGAINIEGIPGPYSCLTSDYTLDLAGTVANTAKYGDMYGYGVDNFENWSLLRKAAMATVSSSVCIPRQTPMWREYLPELIMAMRMLIKKGAGHLAHILIHSTEHITMSMRTVGKRQRPLLRNPESPQLRIMETEHTH